MSCDDCDNIHVCASAKDRRLVVVPLCLMTRYNACMLLHRDSFQGSQTCQISGDNMVSYNVGSYEHQQHDHNPCDPITLLCQRHLS
eukprot:8294244-Karenia_brevis.AAC.1